MGRLRGGSASGGIVARLSAIGRWRAAGQEHRARPAVADLPVQIVDHLLRIHDRRRLAAARKQLARSLYQLLLPAADHRRMNPKPPPTAPPGSFPPKAPHARLEFRAMLLPLYTHVSRPFWDRSALSLSRCPKIRSRRSSPPERLMRTPQIIPVEELSQAALLFDAVGRWAQVDPFVLDGPPQALDEDVVVAASASIHADFDPVIPQHRGELVAGELRTLIGIEDVRLAEPGEGLAQRLDAEPCRHRVRQSPGQHPSGCPVDHRDQVQKPLSNGDVLDDSGPRPVRLSSRLSTQKVRVDLVLGMPLAGVPLRPDRPQPELPHQPPDASAAN